MSWRSDSDWTMRFSVEQLQNETVKSVYNIHKWKAKLLWKLCQTVRNAKKAKNWKWKYMYLAGFEPSAFRSADRRKWPLGQIVFKSHINTGPIYNFNTEQHHVDLMCVGTIKCRLKSALLCSLSNVELRARQKNHVGNNYVHFMFFACFASLVAR